MARLISYVYYSKSLHDRHTSNAYKAHQIQYKYYVETFSNVDHTAY